MSITDRQCCCSSCCCATETRSRPFNARLASQRHANLFHAPCSAFSALQFSSRKNTLCLRPVCVYRESYTPRPSRERRRLPQPAPYQDGPSGPSQDRRQRSQSRLLGPPPTERRRPAPNFRPPPADEPTLSCQQVVSKQVVTRTSGVSLGYIRHLCTDPDTLTVVSADLRPKSLSWGLAASENLLLDTFCQIGDVVLVHDEGALDFVPQDATTGFLDLIGCPVLSSAGAQLGKIREYSFSPDSGRVDVIKFDPLGWPSVPEKLIGAWQVGVEAVEAVEDRRLYLLPQAEAQMMRVSDGPLEAALLALQNLYQDEDTAAGGVGIDFEYENWRRLYGRAFADSFGKAPPATRAELDNFYMGLQAAKQPAEPRSLPPARQPAMSAALRSNSRSSMQQREPEMVRKRQPSSRREDPRLQQRSFQGDSTRPVQQSRAAATPRSTAVRQQPRTSRQQDSGPPDDPRDNGSGTKFEEWVTSDARQPALEYAGRRVPQAAAAGGRGYGLDTSWTEAPVTDRPSRATNREPNRPAAGSSSTPREEESSGSGELQRNPQAGSGRNSGPEDLGRALEGVLRGSDAQLGNVPAIARERDAMWRDGRPDRLQQEPETGSES